MLDVERAKSLYKEGYSLNHIAKTLHTAKITLLNAFKKEGFPTRSKTEAQFTRVIVGAYSPPSGPNHPQYVDGRSHRPDGYVVIKCPGHCRASGPDNYVYEHIVVMEKKLGRSLMANETVHHINHDRGDNRPENLEVIDRRRHGQMHAYERHASNSTKSCWPSQP